MTNMTETIQALADNYLGIGSTPSGALAALTEDLLNNRLNSDDFGATPQELLCAIGNILLEIIDRFCDDKWKEYDARWNDSSH